ncbi:hypothetical protein BGX21_007039, partial [Mortierella sp. AD011]
ESMNKRSSSSIQSHGQQESEKRHKVVQIFKLNANMITSTTYFENGEDVGNSFFKLQLDGVDLVNDPSIMATSENLFCFLSVNSIWDTSYCLGLKKASIENVRTLLTRESFKFAPGDQLLILDLEQGLKSNLKQTQIGKSDLQQT